MIIEYKVNEQDFLDFQLFNASQSERINKKKRNGWIFLTVGIGAVAVYFYLGDEVFMTVYCGSMALACGLFYPRYFIWRYKRHFRTYAKENYSKRFGLSEHLEIKDDAIFSKDKTGESKINLSEIEKIDETQKHFFVKISTGHWLIIPKRELSNPTELITKFHSLGFAVNDMKNWSWK